VDVRTLDCAVPVEDLPVFILHPYILLGDSVVCLPLVRFLFSGIQLDYYFIGFGRIPFVLDCAVPVEDLPVIWFFSL